MGCTLQALINRCDEILEPARFSDYCPNGLQVEGRGEVNRLITGVTACQALIDQAIAQQADAILVHHGYFWKGESQVVCGMKKRRLAALLSHDISLIAYHLPLDAHPTLGNNAQFAARMGWPESGHELLAEQGVGNMLTLPEVISAEAMVEQLERQMNTKVLSVSGSALPIKRVAWCTGAAQSYIELAARHGADAFITGEVSEPTVHFARENGIHFFACGHHASERFGVQALGQLLGSEFGLEHLFIDIPNPV